MDFSERIYPRSDTQETLHFHCCGRRLDAPDHRFGPAAREHYWFIFLESGKGTFTLNRKTFALSPGMVYVCFPHASVFYQAEPGSVWTIRWVSLDGDLLTHLLPAVGITMENPVVVPHEPAKVRDIYAALYEVTDTDTLHDRLRCMELTYALLTHLNVGEQKNREVPDYIDTAIHFMEHNFDRELKIEELAAYVNLERGYFSKLFRARWGMSPKKWLTTYRMEKAAVLLTETGLTVGEIALSVGYGDPLYFSRLFHETYGTCPSTFRSAAGDSHGVT